jgi:hypothetical protein
VAVERREKEDERCALCMAVCAACEHKTTLWKLIKERRGGELWCRNFILVGKRRFHIIIFTACQY